MRQTINLECDVPLAAGSYEIQVSPAVQTEAFNDSEADLLDDGSAFSGHPVVAVEGNQIIEGATIQAPDLVKAGGRLGGLWPSFPRKTPFLTQLHDDLGALLDAALRERGDDPNLTAELVERTIERITGSLGERGARPARLLIAILDPVSFALNEPDGDAVTADLSSNTVENDIEGAFVEVGGNFEIVRHT